jgi:hypothetical protein
MCVRAPLVAILVLAACGNERDARLDEYRRRCEELAVGQTFREVLERLQAVQAAETVCSVAWRPAPSGDACPYAPETAICITALARLTSDERACEGPQRGTCEYRCEVRTVGAVPDGELPDTETPICARQFIE